MKAPDWTKVNQNKKKLVTVDGEEILIPDYSEIIEFNEQMKEYNQNVNDYCRNASTLIPRVKDRHVITGMFLALVGLIVWFLVAVAV